MRDSQVSEFNKFKILNQPSVKPLIQGDRKFSLENDVSYQWEHDGQHQIDILAGYQFDGASVPPSLSLVYQPYEPSRHF